MDMGAEDGHQIMEIDTGEGGGEAGREGLVCRYQTHTNYFIAFLRCQFKYSGYLWNEQNQQLCREGLLYQNFVFFTKQICCTWTICETDKVVLFHCVLLFNFFDISFLFFFQGGGQLTGMVNFSRKALTEIVIRE